MPIIADEHPPPSDWPAGRRHQPRHRASAFKQATLPDSQRHRRSRRDSRLRHALGLRARLSRLQRVCGFCVVPKKEGRPRTVNTIMSIWRPHTERCILLLDNDFFGQPKEQWQARIDELREGRFKVNFSQGVNVRLVNDEAAQALASVRYYDGRFNRRRLYTAWDNLGQEKIFFEGVDRLEAAGIPPRHLMVYMLVGYAPGETMEQVLHRHRRLEERGCEARTWPRNNEETRHARRSAPTALAATRPVRADPESSRFKRR